MSATRAAIIMVTIALSGCATYKEVKEMPVNASRVFIGAKAESLSSCVFETSKENGGLYHRSYDVTEKTWFVISEFRTLLGSGNGAYNFSVAFQDTPEGTKVDIRSLSTIWGFPQAPVDRIYESATDCVRALAA